MGLELVLKDEQVINAQRDWPGPGAESAHYRLRVESDLLSFC